MVNSVVLWASNAPVKIPANASGAKDIVPIARQLTARDRHQIVSAFDSGHYEMVATFVWTKALTSLKAQLGKLGGNFISEMLDRPDIDETTSIDQKLTDFEALRLAQELGVITGTGAFRLRQACERIIHFGSLPTEDAEEEFAADDAVSVLRACVQNILGFERVEAALDFQRFRESLRARVLHPDDESVATLIQSPYFFHRASIRILLSLIKTASGAQLENAVANANLIVPQVWPGLLDPERVQVGRGYAESINDGRSIAASGLKKLLLKVKGFDYVPEDLRSRSFVRAAHALIAAHEGLNNFYAEGPAIRALEKMGSSIPTPAFPICMSAVLSVRLGNYYGHSWDAQPAADSLLKRVTPDRWIYYLSQCLPTDDRILYKLSDDKPSRRWVDLVEQFSLGDYASELTNHSVKRLISDARGLQPSRLSKYSRSLIDNLGYTSAVSST